VEPKKGGVQGWRKWHKEAHSNVFSNARENRKVESSELYSTIGRHGEASHSLSADWRRLKDVPCQAKTKNEDRTELALGAAVTGGVHEAGERRSKLSRCTTDK